MKYRLIINGAQYFPESAERLKNLLEFARGQVFVELSLTQIHDRKPKFTTKLLARVMRWDLALLNEGDEIWALINGNRAFALFHEHRDSFHSINSDYGQGDGGEVEFLVDGSNEVRHPQRKCVTTDKALSAFLSFYKTGVKPDCVDWEKEDWDTIADSEM